MSGLLRRPCSLGSNARSQTSKDVHSGSPRRRSTAAKRQADVTQHMPEARTSTAGLNLTDSVFERLLAERIVVLGSEVNDEVANRITAQLLLLSAEDSESDIRFYINSPGGSVTAGFAIYDTMQLIEPDVATYAMGLAASMGQFLLSSGTPGKRYALPHARILMHQPSAGVGGTASDIAIQAEVFGKWKQELARITAEQTGQTIEQIIRDGDRDRWFTAEEAREYGFVDHVLSRENQLPSPNGSH
ncbi:ATP-dependent Clp protease proteolytic subunit [Amycolatopsis bartoniae]|uniref:ClpP family protease n=1 Tax=Amycolatopsis bartoniae TaxID=941986 RepID=UPI0021BD3ADC|nr:ATP-dependent Clp protease proteolytic subunit [Amycolatopsis bartoniae]